MSDAPVADLRPAALALCAWVSAIMTSLVPSADRLPLLGVAVAGPLIGVLRAPSGRTRRTVAALAIVWSAVALGVTLRGAVVEESWVAVVAQDRAVAQLDVEVRSDPRVSRGIAGDRATARASVLSIEARGERSTARVTVVLVLTTADARDLRVGEHYRVHARLGPSAFADSAALAVLTEPPVRTARASWTERIAEQVRDAIQRATHGQIDAAGLVPALVDGDERGVPAGVDDDFKTAGLTHLLAVSGTNFVLLGAAWLAVARRCGIRGRGLVPVGFVAVLSLVVLARAEPSVVRAAVMASVALVGLGQGRQSQGVRTLSACVCAVMLFAPGLALSPGFALSALATAGILVFANRWRDALAAWMPGLVAEAIAVTLAAYVVCLPLVVALSGRLSLVAIPANLVAGVVVGPTTILGFLGGAIALVQPALGRLVAAPATWGASWIVEVAHLAAGVPHPDIGVGSGSSAVLVLVILSAALAAALGWLVRRPVLVVLILAIPLVVSLLVPS